ncbi:DNA-binding protein [Pantoea sp. RIT-PI-b]|uniref:MocR-like pyridoxine biosynthesis transcription factor PdxR n=1 Tax=Pantoea sp. RIT-PI-b TaxID=1681195 RepID=UPI0006763B97|nr:PLP-dependent aminotransferase family protein [Pantoea sp. RIT-PI-b]KNC05870.1 DNA-binding protein [Pantoea sp. RIT-PI-b]
MTKRPTTIAIPSLKLIDVSAGAVGRQLIKCLRNAITTGELKPAEELPSTRALASSLGIARGTVVDAFDQLKAEGFLETKVGAGTRVASEIRELLPAKFAANSTTSNQLAAPLPPSVSRLAEIGRSLLPQQPLPFAVALPTNGVAPDDNWCRLGNRVRASSCAAPSGYADPRGLPELRTAIAGYVRRARSVKCTMENIIITSGAQQGLFMAGSVLLSQGDAVLTENPAYHGLTAVLEQLGMRVCAVPVDDEGFNIERGTVNCPDARLAFVTPSHQYPLGMPMSMARRQALVAWAMQNNAWIVEDDYDSELRYAGHPFPAMQSLGSSRVIYLGTLSKVLFPSLRLGYIVAPDNLIEAFTGIHSILDRHSPTSEQHVLAAYMEEGYFEAHIRRIRMLYAERRKALLAALKPSLSLGCVIQPSDQGMHILLWLYESANDVEIAAKSLAAGIAVRPVSPMYADKRGRPGLMLGFGGFSLKQLHDAADVLIQLLRSSLPRKY